MVTLQTNYGDIVIELAPEAAPKTVENFLGYVREGFYDGTIFHRVIDGFMIQGGGFQPGMVPKKEGGEPVENEAKTGLKNEKGTVAMARTMQPHSATSQFFINVADNSFLDHPGQDGWGYCAFGRVVEGMDVVDRIKQVPTGSQAGHQDVPREDVVIEQARVDE